MGIENYTWINWSVFGGCIVAVLLVAVFVAFILKIYKLSPGIVGLAFDFAAVCMLISNGFCQKWDFKVILWANPLWLLFLCFGIIFGLFAVSEDDQRLFGYISVAIPAITMTTFMIIIYVSFLI